MNRRKILIGSTSVLVIPEKWLKPVINTTLLPTHARSSLPPPPVTVGGGGEPICLSVCEVGVDDAFASTPVLSNTSEDPIVVTGVTFSNANHYTTVVFPIDIPPEVEIVFCGFVIPVHDSSRTCPNVISDGTITLHFDEFQDLDIQIP